MNGLKVLSPLLILSICTQPLHAATEFVDSVPLEVVKQFVVNPLGGEPKLYADILDEFPPFTVPAGFSVLASADLGFFQRVVLVTDLDEAAAGNAITAAFTAEGWQQIPAFGMAAQTGFISAAPAALPQQLCHDDHGTLSVAVSPGTGTRYVNLNRNVGSPAMGMTQPACAELLNQANQRPTLGIRGGPPGPVLNQYVPRLLMPVSSTRPAPSLGFFGGGGGGGGMNDWEARGTLSIDWSIDEVFEHFTAQIAEQGWVIDSDVTGALVATGSWSKTVDGMDLVGTLTILELADATWDLRFRLVRKGQQGANANQGSFTDSPSIRVRTDP